MKLKCFSAVMFLHLLLNTFILSQTLSDTTDEQPIQYRRGIALQEGYISYDEYYSGKDMLEEKRRLFPLESTGVWTELNPKVPRVDYIGVDFINPDTGWAVGLWGAVIKTTNAGQSWKTIPTPTGEILLKVHSYNGQVVMVVGHNGTILRSSDGGESFSLLTGITTQELWGVKMLNDTLGWICGRNNTLLKTTDAGLTWQTVVTGYNYHYWQFDFLTEDYFMIACSQGKVLKTTNGGQSFTQYQAGSTQDLYTIDIIDSLHIAAAGNYGKNVYSSDGGLTWIENQYTALSINWIQYINRDTGYITIGTISSFYKTTNRGQSWFNPGFNGTGEWQFEVLNENIGYGVGAGLKVSKTEDGFITGRNLILNVDFRDVFFFNEITGFALSWFLYKTTNGGLSWQRNENAPGGNDIIFLDSLIGFIGGSNLFKTTNGGESWYQVNGVPGGVGKIFFINPLTGWATSGRNILKTTDGGENWFVQFTHISLGFTSIYLVDSLYGWATILGNRPYKTTDGGNTWIEQINLDIWESDDVYFYDYLKGWIISGNKLYYTTNSGNEWIQDPQIYTYSRSFEKISNTHFIITGTNIYESLDTGIVWQNITSQVGSYFNALHAPKNYLAYGVGPLGYIVTYLDTSIVPVELVEFTAEQINNHIIIKWTTATETNNYGFEIFRSINLDNWIKIGFIPGYGTTTETQNYYFNDISINNENIYYKLKQLDFNGSFNFSKIINVNIQIQNFELNQNYPNPSNPTTNISFSIPQKSFVKINLYSINGELIKELINEEREQGVYNLEINLSYLSSGVYFYRMITSSGYQSTKKLIILK